MDLGSIFLILALLVLVGLFVIRPFFERTRSAEMVDSSADHELSSLLAERDRILTALQELDFDHALGKVPEEDYPVSRAGLLQHGAEVLRRLDTLQAQLGDQAAGEPKADDVEARIEAAIAARRQGMPAYAVSNEAGQPGNGHRSPEMLAQLAPPDDDLETLLANRRRQRQEKSAGFCPQCGNPVQKSDRFCPKCGAKLSESH